MNAILAWGVNLPEDVELEHLGDDPVEWVEEKFPGCTLVDYGHCDDPKGFLAIEASVKEASYDFDPIRVDFGPMFSEHLPILTKAWEAITQSTAPPELGTIVGWHLMCWSDAAFG